MIFSAARNPNSLLTSAILLVDTALGDAILFASDLRKKTGPIFLAFIHAVVTLAAVGTVPIAFKNILPGEYPAYPAITPGPGFLDLEVLLPGLPGLGSYIGGEIVWRKADPAP